MKSIDELKNTVILGDCLEKMQDIPDKSIDMILCDLPYGTTACKWDVIIPFDKLWENYKRIIKDIGAIVLFGSQPFTSVLITSNMQMFKYCFVWNKGTCGNFVHVNFQPLKVHEDICIFSKGGSAQGSKFPMIYNKQIEKGEPYFAKGTNSIKTLTGGNKQIFNNDNLTGDRMPKSIIDIRNKWKKGERLHPTQKSIELCEYLIKTYTNKDNLVLDNCAGSGTTGIAAHNLNRNYILIEKEPKYYDIILERLSAPIIK